MPDRRKFSAGGFELAPILEDAWLPIHGKTLHSPLPKKENTVDLVNKRRRRWSWLSRQREAIRNVHADAQR